MNNPAAGVRLIYMAILRPKVDGGGLDKPAKVSRSESSFHGGYSYVYGVGPILAAEVSL